MIKHFDSLYLQEQEKFLKAKEKYDGIFDDGELKSKLSDVRDNFAEKFNTLAKFLLKSNKKVEVFSRGSYSGKIYIGGKSGITSRDYGGDGLSQQGVIDFFTNLDKIDIILRRELTKHYYDKWLSFVSCFGGGVEKILLSKSEGDNLRKAKSYSEMIILMNKDIPFKDNTDEMLSYEMLSLVKMSEIFIEDNGDKALCRIRLIDDDDLSNNDIKSSLNIVDLDNENLFFFRDYVDDMIELADEYAKLELVIYAQQKIQYDIFIQKASPYLSLGDL